MKSVVAVFALAFSAMLAPSQNHPHPPAALTPHPESRGHAPSEVRDRCRFEAERNLTVAADPGDTFRLRAGSGSLEVMGVPGLDRIQVTARACASDEDLLEELRVTADRNGGEIFVDTHYPDTDGWSWGNRYARLDLVVEVPEAMEAEIRDSSGEMRIGHLGSLRIQDGSGEMEVFSIQGNVSIDDNSGEIALWDVTGDVEIDDGSGEIEMEGIGGSVILNDGSGEIDARDIEGTVRVVRDGSGSIDVDGVGGDFVVERDGSGGINFRNVQGRVDIPRRR